MRILTIILLVGATSAACNEPKYQNRPLSAWSYDLDSDRDYERRAGCEALGKIGPLAASEVPALIELSTRSAAAVAGV